MKAHDPAPRTLGLFGDADHSVAPPARVPLAAGALLLRGFASAEAERLLAALRGVVARAPLRHMLTPGGHRMSVAMSNCGALGWVSDPRGYRYDALDPDSGLRWPALPPILSQLAARAAAAAGFAAFAPDACLINRYEPGARLTLHQDRNERDFGQPIVSISLGLPALFLFGGTARADPTLKLPLAHGDVVVWGGPARLRFHGVKALADGWHAATGRCRINLTLRKAG